MKFKKNDKNMNYLFGNNYLNIKTKHIKFRVPNDLGPSS